MPDLPKAKLGTKLFAAVAAAVAALLLAEGGLRIRQRLRYGTWGVSVSERHRELDPATGLAVLRPGTPVPGITINSRGFRGPEIETPKPAGRVRIAFLGASTTYCAEASDDRRVWPHLVCEALRGRHPERAFDYVNAGVPGYVVEDSMRNFELRVAPLEPDIVVIYHATNDLSLDTRALARAQGLFHGRAEDPSWLARRSVLWNLLEKNYLVWKRSRDAASGVGRLQFDAEALAAGFRERMERLCRAAASGGRLAAVATFATKFRADQPEAERLAAARTSLFYMPYMSVDGLLAGFDAYNRAIHDAARNAGAILVDGERSIPGDDRHFRDSVHFTDDGCAAMARRVVEALEAAPEFRALLGRHQGAAGVPKGRGG